MTDSIGWKCTPIAVATPELESNATMHRRHSQYWIFHLLVLVWPISNALLNDASCCRILVARGQQKTGYVDAQPLKERSSFLSWWEHERQHTSHSKRPTIVKQTGTYGSSSSVWFFLQEFWCFGSFVFLDFDVVVRCVALKRLIALRCWIEVMCMACFAYVITFSLTKATEIMTKPKLGRFRVLAMTLFWLIQLMTPSDSHDD